MSFWTLVGWSILITLPILFVIQFFSWLGESGPKTKSQKEADAKREKGAQRR